MSVSFPGGLEQPPTTPLVINGAEIEPWTPEMIRRNPPVYTFHLQLSRTPTSAEEVVLDWQLEKISTGEGFEIAPMIVVQKVALSGIQLLVGELGFTALKTAAPYLDQLVRDVERIAREESSMAHHGWKSAGDGASALQWPAGT